MANNKNILIGGITGGLGARIAHRLLAGGHTVAGFARDQDRLEKLKESHEGLHTASCDATDPEAVESTFAKFAESMGSIDAYIHAVGSIFIKPAHATSLEDWKNTLETNLYSAFFALKSAAGRMQKRGSGNCLFFSTSAAQIGIANHEAIAVAKGGIDAMVRSAAATYASRGVRINAIAPSLMDTPLSKPITANEKSLELSKQMHPLGAITDPEDVASLAEWLVSDQAKFVTGQTYVVDGGLSRIVPKPKA
ncbi:MAG: SDR family NAD(P)-dependent oxidoreductase [Opitutales bacterium]